MRGVKASKGPVFKIQGQGTQRRYPEELKKAIAEMAIIRGNKVTAEHFSRELGSRIHAVSVSNLKRAHLGIRNKKAKGEDEEEDGEGEEEETQGGGEHVGGEVSISYQEEGVIIDARKEGQGQDAQRDVDEEGNIQQVTFSSFHLLWSILPNSIPVELSFHCKAGEEAKGGRR